MVKVVTPIDVVSVPGQVQLLIDQREAARREKNYLLSDQLRDQIKDLGYLVNDSPSGLDILKIGDETKKPAKNYLVLFGSGEIAPSSVTIYRDLFLSLEKKDLNIALITTAAGFQPNVDYVYQEIKDFLLASLPDFNLTINILPINNRNLADQQNYLDQINISDIIFLGPGSPTYAVKHLMNTKTLQTIIEQVKKGTTLILASAATIAFSHMALPVYEIYKVGEDLNWQHGLDLYSHVWQKVTIIPHFNNREGGEHLDTTHCYIGKNRFDKLRSMLPKDEVVYGIDEHTALIVDLSSQDTLVKGKGGARIS